MLAGTRFYATATDSATVSVGFLHERSLHKITETSARGFSLIELLIVVLLIGIICAGGVSIYAGVTTDSQIRARTDELRSFFYACKHRASMRKTPVTIQFQNQTLFIEQSSSLKLQIPELDEKTAIQMLTGLRVDPQGFFTMNSQRINTLTLPLTLPGNRPHKITLEF